MKTKIWFVLIGFVLAGVMTVYFDKSNTPPVSACPQPSPTRYYHPTRTPCHPTNTPVPPTDTPIPNTDTPVPPTKTKAPTKTNTQIPPTVTRVPPTNTKTPVPPTNTPTSPIYVQPTPTKVVSSCQVEIISQSQDNKEYTSVWHYEVNRASMITVGAGFNSTANLPDPQSYFHPTIDPNGTCLEVFTRVYSDNQGKTRSELWTHALDGSNPRKITYQGIPVEGFQPDWGYLTNRIVYVDPSGLGIMKVDPHAWNAPASLGVKGVNPSISPDGNWVAYSDYPDVNTQLLPTLSFVNIYGAIWGHYETNLQCFNPQWLQNGNGVVCNRPRASGTGTTIGIVMYTYNSGSIITTYLNDYGLYIAMDPTGSTKVAAITGGLVVSKNPYKFEENGWIVKNMFPLTGGPQLTPADSGTFVVYTYGAEIDWWSWLEIHPSSNIFMNEIAFLFKK